VLLALILIPVAFYMPVNGTGKALMVGSVIWVLVVELLNSGIEGVTDRVYASRIMHICQRAKDLGSAAVMLSLAALIAIWLFALLG